MNLFSFAEASRKLDYVEIGDLKRKFEYSQVFR